MTSTLMTTRRMQLPGRVALLVTGAGLIVLSCLLGAWIFYLGHPFVIDATWNELLAAWASPFVFGFSLVMNFLGGGWFGTIVVPLGGALALVLMKRPWSAAYFLTAEAVSAGLVQLLKLIFGRVRPQDMSVVADVGSYPSGHVTNAATIATAAVLLFPRLWVLIVGVMWVLLMALSRTYLHVHWLSDTIGGMLLGVGVALVIAAFFVNVIKKERSDYAPEPTSLE